MVAILKHLKKEGGRTHMTFTVSEAERKAIYKLADKYTGGNVSAWLRYSATEYQPKCEELAKVN